MKICVASSGLGHVARGIESWAADLAHALAERGQTVLLCKGDGAAEKEYERVVPCLTRGCERTQRLLEWMPASLGWRLGMGSAYGVEQTTFAWNLIRVLRREDVDILHVQDPFVANLIQIARKIGSVRTRVILAHGTEESWDFLQKMHYVQHLAPWHREQAAAAGIDRRAWTAIPNFIDTQRFHPGKNPELRRQLGLSENTVIVLVAAAIKRRHKRVDYLVREFASLVTSHPSLNVSLIVAGGREAETEALVADAERQLGNRVRFLIQTPRDQMPDLYRVADIFMLGSLKEMMPIALIEAAASGLPCIVNAHPVMQWMVGAGGLSIDMSRAGTLAETLLELCTDTARRQQMGRAARAHTEALFSRDRVVDQVLEYYRLVGAGKLDEPGGPGIEG